MKKLFIFLLSMILVFALTACKDETESSDDVISGVPNPMVEVDTLEELSEKGTFKVSHVENATDEKYFTYDIDPMMYEYQFVLNDLDCRLRYSTEKENDISGIYLSTGGTVFEDSTEDNAYFEGEGYKVQRWFSEEGQYILMINDDGNMSKDDFDGVVAQIKQ